jgi:Flp pilus assembly pilin Flp
VRFLLDFHRDQRAASAAEFALVVPLLILLLLGSIDVGRFMWNVNEAEKATQIGTRWAVATDMIPTDLYNYSFATSGGIQQGTVVTATDFPGVSCSASGTTVSCPCKAACSFGESGNSTAFNALVARMSEIYGGIGPDNVEVDYDWSGLGYSGDPNGSDVDPLVTVRVTNLNFRPIFLGGIFNFGLPDLSYTLTMEDGQGSVSN